MSAWNPGSAHFDDYESEKSPLVTIDDLPAPSGAVSGISNNPAKVIED